MYLHSTIEDHQNNLDHRDCSPKLAAQQEDLLFLAQMLQEHLRAEVPSGEFFQVQCAAKNDRLMILTQHPKSVWPDTEKVFLVLEETLQSLSAQQEQQVELFLRVGGQKLPYAKYSLTLGVGKDEGDTRCARSKKSKVKSQKILNERISTSPSGDKGELISLCSSSSSGRTPRLVSAVLVLITVLGSTAYLLTCPCVMFACKEIQTAKQLQRSFRQTTPSHKLEQELAKWQQQFNTASFVLKTMPWWSPYYHEAEKLSANLSGDSEKINLVIKAFQVASLATQKAQTVAHSLEELQDRQQMWRQAIAPLEVIDLNSPLYRLVQQKLWVYRAHLQAVKQQSLIEEKWLKNLAIAKAKAAAASSRGGSTKSLKDLQELQFTWLLAVNALTAIPPNSLGYQEAQKLLAEYKPSLAAVRDRATIELLAYKTYHQAVNTANLAKIYEQQNQWQAAVTHWSLALNAAKQVPNNSLDYSKAQTLIEPYSTALRQAEEKLQIASSFQKTRTDLNKTCSGTIRVCNFTIDSRGITVWVTAEYQQILSSSLMSPNDRHNPNTVTSVTNHLQTLQQALVVISENANLPLVVYGIQGNATNVYLKLGVAE